MAEGHEPGPLMIAGKLASRDRTLILSHQTAAHLWDLWLPASLREPTVHVARRRGHGAIPRIEGTTGHLLAARCPLVPRCRTWSPVALGSPVHPCCVEHCGSSAATWIPLPNRGCLGSTPRTSTAMTGWPTGAGRPFASPPGC